MSIRDEIDHRRKPRFYEFFQASHCLESLFFNGNDFETYHTDILVHHVQDVVLIRSGRVTQVKHRNLVAIAVFCDSSVVSRHVSLGIGTQKLIPEAQANSIFGYRKYAVLPTPAAPIINV